MDNESLKRMALAVLETEAQAVIALRRSIDDHFVAACQCLLACEGRTVVTGMGKSGHIARKIAATLASTGSPAFFLHPAEASHGDIGMISRRDVVMAISNSGETPEILFILPTIKRMGIPVIGLTGNASSTIARAATVHIDVGVEREACPLGLAPTASTTAALAMGDALAISLLQFRGFTEKDFAHSHPGGILGRRLLLRVEDLMHQGEQVPRVLQDTPVTHALLEMTRKGLGMTTIVDAQGRLQGIFTDGDLRRALESTRDLRQTRVDQVMTPHGKTISSDMLAVDALNLMEMHKITALVVTDPQDRVIGILHMHDLLRAGVV